ncbi:MAG: AAA family ATPase [Burkholderiales bacterium]|nr:AAA family ATPase [Burkholderiales bacterium]
MQQLHREAPAPQKRYAAVPVSLRKIKNAWLGFRFEQRGGKVAKIPHYHDGRRRSGTQGSESDRLSLGSFAQVVTAIDAHGFDGIGIAMLPENQLIALDFDKCIDAQGGIAPWVLDLVAGTYYEISPSGRGMRAFFRGAFDDYKNLATGIEVFHAQSFVTVTGNKLPSSADAVAKLSDELRGKLEALRPAHQPAASGTADSEAPYVADVIDNLTQAHLKDALDFLPADDREEWVMVAHALKPLGEKGMVLWRDWSMKSGKYDTAEAKRVWRSVKKSKTGYRAVFALAHRKSWPGPQSTSTPTSAVITPKPAAPLLAQTFEPLRWTIRDILPAGCYLLSARPKIGKSWMALQFGVAVTEGGIALGKQALKGAVLGLFLEDNERRLQARLLKHELGRFGDANLFFYETEWPRAGEGGEQAIEAWLRATPNARLVIVDTLEKIRPRRTRNGSVYADDYAATQELKKLSDKYGITILIIAHNKKGKSENDDPLELVSGSMGLTGGSDGALVIERPRGQTDAKLHVSGRDIEYEPDAGYVIRFNKATCKWEMVGDAALLGNSAAQQSILDAIRRAGHPLTAEQVGKATRRNRQAARHILMRLVDAGKLVEVAGRPIAYDLPDSGSGNHE